MSLSRSYPSFDLRRSFFLKGKEGDLLFREINNIVLSSRDLRNAVLDELIYRERTLYNKYDGNTYSSTANIVSVAVDSSFGNSFLEIDITGDYTHANNSSIEVYFGTSNSTSDSKIIDVALTSSSLLDVKSKLIKVSGGAAKYIVHEYIPGATFTGSSSNITTNIDYAITQFFTVRFVAGASSTFDLYNINVSTSREVI